jgi:hypothetical protein
MTLTIKNIANMVAYFMYAYFIYIILISAACIEYKITWILMLVFFAQYSYNEAMT